MNIKYCPIDGGNFGDDLNTLLWARLFPDLSRLKEKVLVFGIGTLLDGRHDPRVTKIVLGSGLGTEAAASPDHSWEFRWVRGPLTAQAFGLSSERALGDAALLWPELQPRRDAQLPGPIGLIPHFRTWDSFDWHQVAADAGMVAINPRQSPSLVIAQLRTCSRVMAESLHGAICADAMGIPWAPCVLAHRFNEFKWNDWLATVNRPFMPCIADRPLVRSVTPTKALANRLARLVSYQSGSRRPALRPVAAATVLDAQQVSRALRNFAGCDANFSCSTASQVSRQRERMVAACRQFASDYSLRFNP